MNKVSLFVALACSFGGGVRADTKEGIQSLRKRADVAVIGQVTAPPQRSRIIEPGSYSIFFVRFQVTRFLKGAKPTSRNFLAEFDVNNPRIYRLSHPPKRRKEPDSPSVSVGQRYIFFLHDNGRNKPNWKIIGIRPDSQQLEREIQSAPKG